MQHELNHTVQELLGALGLEAVSRETLAALVREYPYSAILHLLYSRKLQQEQDPRFAESVARTALYFSNPHWLHHLMRPKTGRDAVHEMEQAFTENIVPSDQPGQPDAGEAELEPASDLQLSPEEPQPPIYAETQGSEAPVEIEGSSVSGESTIEAAIPIPEIEASVEFPKKDNDEHGAEWHMPDIRPLETTPGISGFGLPPQEIAAIEEGTPGAEEIAPENTNSSTGSNDRPAGPLVPAETGLIPLEPYYTIDYFASQGIQLSEEEKLDPLGRKLKRFTDWLKTMKKIHPDKTRPEKGHEDADEDIREGAEHSNDRAEVVTEAMAEVYQMQGQPDKAAEIYRKLSLLDPSRSATFAAKIAELNLPDA